MVSEDTYFDGLLAKENRRRGFDHEVNQETDITGQREICMWRKCQLHAVKRRELKEVGAPGSGVDVDLCADHDSEENAWEIYGDRDDGPDPDEAHDRDR